MVKFFKEMRQIVKNSKLMFIVLVVLGTIQAVLSVLFALSIKNIINSASDSNSGLLYSAINSCSLLIAFFIISIINRFLTEKYVIDTQVKLKKFAFSSYIENNLQKINLIPTGNVVSRINNDSSTLASTYVTFIPNVITLIVRVFAIIIALFILAPFFTLILSLIGIIILVATYFIRKISFKLYKDYRAKEEKVTDYCTETCNNSLVVKVFNNEEKVENVNEEKLKDLASSQKRRVYFSNTVSLTISFAFSVFYIATAIWGAYAILNKVIEINFGDITAMLQLILQIRSPITSLGSVFSIYNEMIASYNRLIDLKTNENISKISCEDKNFKSLKVQSVSFSYKDKKVLSGVSFEVNKGDKIVLKGTSGIGKSTLLKVISGVYTDYDGEVIANFDGESYSTKDLKNLFSIAPQGNMLYSSTFDETLAFACSNKENVDNVVKACMLEDVKKQLDTKDGFIGIMGNNLSQGQAQRLAVARSIIADRQIILLDEPTSAIDKETEESLIKNIFSDKDLTIIVVTHKKLAETYANKVYRLDKDTLIQEK